MKILFTLETLNNSSFVERLESFSVLSVSIPNRKGAVVGMCSC